MMLTCGALYAEIVVDDFLSYEGFVDLSGVIAVPIPLRIDCVVNDSVTLRFTGEVDKAYLITSSSNLSPSSWNIDGTTARFNGIEVIASESVGYLYTALAAETVVEISFTNATPKQAFFKAAELVVFGSPASVNP